MLIAISWSVMQPFQSTSPVRGTTVKFLKLFLSMRISIHVPREGDDGLFCCIDLNRTNFNPRPP